MLGAWTPGFPPQLGVDPGVTVGGTWGPDTWVLPHWGWRRIWGRAGGCRSLDSSILGRQRQEWDWEPRHLGSCPAWGGGACGGQSGGHQGLRHLPSCSGGGGLGVTDSPLRSPPCWWEESWGRGGAAGSRPPGPLPARRAAGAGSPGAGSLLTWGPSRGGGRSGPRAASPRGGGTHRRGRTCCVT